MTVGCMIFYNEAWILERTIPALQRATDRVVLVDGPYEAFEHRGVMSDDGSYGIARKMLRGGDRLIARAQPWVDEVEKRNEYLAECEEGDWVLVADADEEVTGSLPALEGWGYRLEMTDAKFGNKMPLFRLFKKGRKTEYRGAHNVIFENGTLLNNEPMPMLEGLGLLHHRLLRPWNEGIRSRAKGKYVQWLAEREGEFRDRWNPQS
jgi:glycosyltransferase involved in cell wall biosynthesis